MSHKFYTMNLITQSSMPEQITVIDVVDSTMIKGRDMLNAGVSRPFGVVSNQQTAGYGKKGRSFFSPKGAGIYQTFVFDIQNEFDAGLLTTGVAVSVAHAIFKVSGIQVDLKWVNDLYLNDRKIAGILVEGILTNNVVTQVAIGIGLNILPTAVPQELKHIVGTLGVDVDKNLLVQTIFSEIVGDFSDYKSGLHLTYYRNHSYLQNKHVILKTGNAVVEGDICGVGDHGELLIEQNGHVSAFISGDVAKVVLREIAGNGDK